jgi:hypothetical protein
MDLPAIAEGVDFQGGPFGREEYILRSRSDALYLIGATDLAVQDAVWDLLYRVGYRQFFPGETWEVIPERRDLTVDLDVREAPAFAARRIWYNWGLWGYNNEPYRQWCEDKLAARGALSRMRILAPPL